MSSCSAKSLILFSKIKCENVDGPELVDVHSMEAKEAQITQTRLLGPLHMSPVDRAGPVSEISPRHSFLYKNFDVFI